MKKEKGDPKSDEKTLWEGSLGTWHPKRLDKKSTKGKTSPIQNSGGEIHGGRTEVLINGKRVKHYGFPPNAIINSN